MTQATQQRVTNWIDMVYKLSIPCMVIGSFYLNSTFASKEEVRAMLKSQEDRVTKAETAILLLAKDNETNGRQDKSIEDHELRLRSLETRR